MTRGIPKDTQAFLRAHIRSIGQLEFLLALREGADRSWTPEAAAKHQRVDPAVAEAQMLEAAAAGFLDGPGEQGEFRYSPKSHELAGQLDRLAEIYKTYRVSVINFVFSMPSESVQSFADAFRIRRDEDDG